MLACQCWKRGILLSLLGKSILHACTISSQLWGSEKRNLLWNETVAILLCGEFCGLGWGMADRLLPVVSAIELCLPLSPTLPPSQAPYSTTNNNYILLGVLWLQITLKEKPSMYMTWHLIIPTAELHAAILLPTTTFLPLWQKQNGEEKNSRHDMAYMLPMVRFFGSSLLFWILWILDLSWWFSLLPTWQHVFSNFFFWQQQLLPATRLLLHSIRRSSGSKTM